MPLHASGIPSKVFKYDSSQQELIVNETLNFPVSAPGLDLRRSECKIYYGSSGSEIYFKLKNLAPSLVSRISNLETGKFALYGINNDNQDTSLVCAVEDGLQSYFRFRRLDRNNGVGAWDFRCENGVLECSKNLNDSFVPKSWSLSVDGIANVLTEYRVGDTKVLGYQQPAIPAIAPTATLADVIASLNTILTTMRTHGLIAL